MAKDKRNEVDLTMPSTTKNHEVEEDIQKDCLNLWPDETSFTFSNMENGVNESPVEVNRDSLVESHPETLSTSSDSQLRRSERIRRMNLEDNDASKTSLASFVATCGDRETSDPRNYEEALNSSDAELWNAAMKQEYDSLMKNRTWTLVDRPKGRNIVKTKWVFKTKLKGDGSQDKLKARLVAKGYSQRFGEDYTETFSPVIRYETVRVMLAIAAAKDMEMIQFDVATAFLNGELKEEVFMEQPQGFLKEKDKV